MQFLKVVDETRKQLVVVFRSSRSPIVHILLMTCFWVTCRGESNLVYNKACVNLLMFSVQVRVHVPR